MGVGVKMGILCLNVPLFLTIPLEETRQSHCRQENDRSTRIIYRPCGAGTGLGINAESWHGPIHVSAQLKSEIKKFTGKMNDYFSANKLKNNLTKKGNDS